MISLGTSFFCLAALALCQGAAPGHSVQEMIADLKSESDEVRSHAARALARAGPDARTAVRPLVRAFLREKVFYVTEEMHLALVQIGEPAAPVLLEVLGDISRKADPRVRVMPTLAALAPKAPKQIISALTRAAKDNDREVSSYALFYIGRIDSKTLLEHASLVLPVLSEALTRKDRKQAFNAARILLRLRPDDEQAAAVLARTLQEPIGEGNALDAAYALLESKKWANRYADQAIPVAVRHLEYGRTKGYRAGPHWREAYVLCAIHLGETLKGLGRDARLAIPLLAREFEEAKRSDASLAKYTAGILLQLKPENKEARRFLLKSIPDLIPWLNLDDAHPYLLFTCKIVGELGPDAREAIPALERLRDSKNPVVRRAARTALQKIR